jgi:hypothetical protein
MPTLHELQESIRRSVLEDPDREPAACIAGGALEPGQRLSVYRNTILGTLAKALRLSFPAVHRLVGDDFFEGAAQIFARERPPRCADLNAYGAGFPDFLERFEPAAMLTYLPDVARLEWAVNRALHAADAQALDPSELAAVAPADQDHVSFVAHPSISMLRSDFPIDGIWRAVLQQDEVALVALDPNSGPVHLMVHRLGGAVEVARLDEAAWTFSSALLGGQPLAATLAASPGIDGAALLADHLLRGHCVAFNLPQPRQRQ